MRHALRGDARLEVGRGDRVAVGELAGLGLQVTADVEQHTAGDDDGCRVLDARHEVAVARHDVTGATAVPGDAVVEDVAEPVPLRRALERHRDHVVGAADAVREALIRRAPRRCRCRSWCAPGWCGGASPSAARSCRTTAPGRRPAPPARALPRPRALSGIDEVERAEHVVLAPPAPVAVGLRAGADLGLGVRPVEVGGVLRRPGHCAAPSATQRTTWVPRPLMVPVMTSPSCRNRFQC